MRENISQQLSGIVKFAGMAKVMSGAAVVATFMTWAPMSAAGANGNHAPATPSAMPAQVADARQSPAQPARGSAHNPSRPTCAAVDAIGSTRALASTVESRFSVGCGVRGNVADGALECIRGGDQASVATFLAWSEQASIPGPCHFRSALVFQMKAQRS